MSAVRSAEASGLRVRLLFVMLSLVMATVVAAGWQVVGAFDRAVAPEVSKRTRLIGTIVRSELQRALELGMTLETMTGVDRYLAETLEKFSEVEAIAIRAADGRPVAQTRRASAAPQATPAPAFTRLEVGRGRYVLPIVDNNRIVGEVQVDTSAAFVHARLRDVLIDVMVIALVGTLVAVELTLLVIAVSVTRPLDRVTHQLGAQAAGDFSWRGGGGGLGGLARTAQRLDDRAEDLAERWAQLAATARDELRRRCGLLVAHGRPPLMRLSDIGDIRLPLFLYVIATEIAVAFLPIYSRSLARADWLTPEAAAAAPLVCYLGAAALFTPFAGRLSRRFGPRRLFLWTIPPTALSLAALAMATHVVEVALWRGVMAAFYALATIACQEYAIRASRQADGSGPVGSFMAVVYGGVFCGAALGGVLAGRFGYPAALLGGAALALIAGGVGAATLRGVAGESVVAAAGEPAVVVRWRPGARTLATLLGLALPMSVTTAVFVWYLTPLMLTELGSRPAEVGRVMMLYYLAVVLFGSSVTAASSGRVGPRALAAAGALVAATGLLSLSAWQGFWAVTVAMAALGLGHTLLRTPLYAWAQHLEPGGALRMPLRLTERLGAIVGLALSAAALPSLGAEAGVRALGMLTLAGLLAFVLVEARHRWTSRTRRASPC